MIPTKLSRDLPIVLGIVAVVAAALFPVFARQRPEPYRMGCMSHVKQMAIANVMYLSDFDRYPDRDAWIDQSHPYAKTWDVFHCPFFEGTAWGYAFNGALSRTKEPAAPAKTPMVYDSVNPVKNASDLVASLPTVPRHKTNVMGYADGHAKAIENAPAKDVN